MNTQLNTRTFFKGTGIAPLEMAAESSPPNANSLTVKVFRIREQEEGLCANLLTLSKNECKPLPQLISSTLAEAWSVIFKTMFAVLYSTSRNPVLLPVVSSTPLTGAGKLLKFFPSTDKNLRGMKRLAPFICTRNEQRKILFISISSKGKLYSCQLSIISNQN